MSRIRKKVMAGGKTRWYPLTIVNGKETPLGGFRTKTDAQAVLKAAEAQIASGVFMKVEEKDPSFSEWVDTWLEGKKRSLKASTYASYESAFKTHILPFFKDKPLSKINNEVIEEWVTWMEKRTLGGKEKKKKLTPATVGKNYRYLRACLRKAYRKGYLPEYPCIDVDLPRVGRNEIDCLDDVEINRLLDAAEEPWRTLFAVLGMSGLRLGEALALRWRDIDFEMRAIKVTRSWSQWNGFAEPKSESSVRAVPIMDKLETILIDHRQGNPKPDELLFPGVGERPLDPKTCQLEFYGTLERAKLKRVTLHSLRHSFATMLLTNGGTIKDCQTLLGHSDPALTLRVYSHVCPTNLSESMARMNARLTATKEGKVKSIKQ